MLPKSRLDASQLTVSFGRCGYLSQKGTSEISKNYKGHLKGCMCPSRNTDTHWLNVIPDQAETGLVEHVLPPPSYQCGGSGWTSVALVNMTDTGQQCPSGLTLTSYSKRTCGRTTSTGGTCDSTSFSVGGVTYSRVCGRIIGYQFGIGAAFLRYNRGLSTTIDSPYVGGVSLTHGAPGARQHIWTFATGITEVDQSSVAEYLCPCSGFHPLWGMTTSVKVVWTLHTVVSMITCFNRMTLCGTDRTAELAPPAVSSTLHRGLLELYRGPRVMT